MNTQEAVEAARRIAQDYGKCAAGLFVRHLKVSYATAVQLQDLLNSEHSEMTQTAHAFLPPSGASSWVHCSLWPTMNQRFPQDESLEATEGTAAHWVGWEILKAASVQVGQSAPGNQIVTEEMIEGGELLVDTIQRRSLAAGHKITSVETPLTCYSIHRQVWGTPDYWSISENRRHIEIIDYKYGHRFVDEFWNYQGLCYLAGILDAMKITLDPGVTVSFTIVQPRCFYKGEPVRTHTYGLTETREHFNRLAMMAELAMIPEPKAVTNPRCGDCPGRHACSALQLAAYSDAEYSNARTPVELSPAAAALELKLLQRALERLQARVDGLKEQTIANIKAGKQVPFFRAEPGYGRQAWKIPDSQVIATGKMFGLELSKAGVITPKQAEKLGMDASIVAGYSFTPSTGFRLVADNSTDAARTFGALKE